MGLTDILFLDIETAGQAADFDALDDRGKTLWQIKAGHIVRLQDPPDIETSALFVKKAAIYAEFGRVVNISLGWIQLVDNEHQLRLKSIYAEDERTILLEFSNLLSKHFSDPAKHFLCGHNIREFDIPFLCRRMLVHGIPLPSILDIGGKKPWQVTHLFDTFEWWKFGDLKTYTSLDLLSYALGIPSPKAEMDGSMVHEAYWDYRNYKSISKYCELDVVTVVQIFRKMNYLPLLTSENILSITT